MDLASNKSDSNPILTVIIPLRITDQRTDLLERINYYQIDTDLPDEVNFIVVDDGSTDEFYSQIQATAGSRITVYRTGAKSYQDFSLSRARNYAAQRANGRFIMFIDADLLPYPGFFRDILREIKASNLYEQVDQFLMLPVIYLTDSGFAKMQDMEPQYWRQYFINSMLRDDKQNIEKFSSGTSVIVIDRYYYLSRGGQDEQFEGWGFEDYEFATRLIRRVRRFPLPHNWLSMAGNFMQINKYEGWKATYRLYGDWMAAKGIYMFHSPHPIEATYHRRKDTNLRYLKARMAEYASTGYEHDPLPALERGKSLLFSKNPFCLQREFSPFFGEVIDAPQDGFSTEAELELFIKEHKISRIVLGNPYANEKTNTVYQWCTNNKFPTLVCERGALPDSIYHDPNGFLNDSTSYSAENWDFPLTQEERKKTIAYIDHVRVGKENLEQQSERVDTFVLRKRFGINKNQKVLFVPFQQPNDTVISNFSGPIENFSNFYEKICSLVIELGPDWKVIYKKHPVEDSIPEIPGAISAHETNMHDLLELCDAVALINSGVGIYAMMYGKPLYVFGDAWYNFQGLCESIVDPNEAATLIRQKSEIDYEKVLRFTHYLRYKFYSFGKMITRRVRYDDGSPITATTEIQYYEIRGFTDSARTLQKNLNPIPSSSPIFDRYKNASGNIPQYNQEPVNPAQNATNNNISKRTKSLTDVTLECEPNGYNESITNAARAYNNKEFSKAALYFDKAISFRQGHANTLRMAAEAHYSAGNKTTALKYLILASELLPKNKSLAKRFKALSSPTWRRSFIFSKPFPITNA